MRFIFHTSMVFAIFIIFIFSSNVLLAQDSKKSIFKKKRDKVEISDMELRLRLSDFYVRYTEYVEETADKIYYQTSDPVVKRAALMWKIYGISAMNKAINMPDPVASFYNAWPFAKQSVIFFENGVGKEKLGDYHNLALDLSVKMEAKLDSIIIDIGGIDSYLETEPEIDDWSKNHPIEDFYFSRESTVEYFAKWIGEARLRLGSSVSTITEQMIELSNRINLYADILPRQARWQADFALMNYLEDTAFLLGRIDQLILSLERITKMIEMSPELVEYNRNAAFNEVDRQRRESLELLVKERKAVVNQLIEERKEIVSVIVKERLTVLEELKSERDIVLNEIKEISSEIVVQSGQEIERVIDKIFWRAVILIVVLGLFSISFILIYRRF
jgi:dsDNA-binding SOS-regulon protein